MTTRSPIIAALVWLLLAIGARASAAELVANDPGTDNGPAISAGLAAGSVQLDAHDYYVATTIEWPKRHGGALTGAGGYTAFLQAKEVGVTRLIWNGPPGRPMIRGPISGGRISQLVIQGGLKAGARASAGILLLNDGSPPTGFTVLDQVAYCNLDAGFVVANFPGRLFGNCITHRDCLWHGVTTPYWIMAGCGQSTRHVFENPTFKTGFKTIFRLEAGGPLICNAPYIGDCEDATLLYLGRPGADGINSGNGLYTITGAQVDGNATRLRLVDHGKFAGRVRIDGSYSITAKRNGLADPLVLARNGVAGNVQIDFTNGVVWPPREATP